MKTTQFLAACALLASAGAAFGHENAAAAHAPDHAPAATPAKEQKSWGRAGDSAAVQRSVTLRMTDAMRFVPSHIEVREGETVRLRVQNHGRLRHEIVLGTPADLEAHAAMMRSHPGMAHDAPHMAHVAPGKTGDVVWQFNRPGNFDFACLIEGHYQAGMTGTITVVARQP